MRKVLSVMAIVGLSTMVSFADTASVTETETGQSFTGTAEFGGNGHTLIGVGPREAYGAFNVYAAGFYVQTDSATTSWQRFLGREGASFVTNGTVNWSGLKDSTALYQWIYSSSFGKAIWMKFVRDVTGVQVTDAYKESLKRSIDDFDAQYANPESPLAKFFAAANHDVANGSEMKLWTRGSTVYLQVPGQPLVTIPDASSIIRPIWRIWFGPNPIQVPLRRGLVNNIENLGGPAPAAL
jgi:hypothetical protein